MGLEKIGGVWSGWVGYVREISLTSTSSKDHLLNNLTVPSPTISAGRIAVSVRTGGACASASPAILS